MDRPKSKRLQAARGLAAMDAAAEAFGQLDETELDNVPAEAIAEARAIMHYVQIVTLNTASVTITNALSWQKQSAPSLTPTLSLTAS